MNSIYKWCDNFLSNLSMLNIIGIFAVLFAVVLVLLQPDNKQSKPITSFSLSYTDEEMYHNALYQAASIDQSCYDSKTNLWFVHSIKPANEEYWSEGWYYELHNNIKVIKLGNSSVAITNIDDVLNARIRPTVTGLSCRTHEPKPTDIEAIEAYRKEKDKKPNCVNPKSDDETTTNE